MKITTYLTLPTILLSTLFTPARGDMRQWHECMTLCQVGLNRCLETWALRGESRGQRAVRPGGLLCERLDKPLIDGGWRNDGLMEEDEEGTGCWRLKVLNDGNGGE